jgi:hypothetical protein
MGMATQFPGERDRGVHLADSAGSAITTSGLGKSAGI